MANIVGIGDFEDGRNAIPLNSFQEDNFTEYISEIQSDFLFRLLGYELSNLFVADLSSAGVPQTPKYLTIYQELVSEIGCEEIRSLGMKEMFKGIVHFSWARDQFGKVDTTGVNRNESENSNNVTTLAYDLYTRYNKSIEMAWAIQQYICDNRSDYPEFKGQKLEMALPL